MKSWKKNSYRAAAILSLASMGGAAPAAAQELNKLTPAETAAGFKLLWDGTLAGRSSFLKSGEDGTSLTWGIDDNGIKDPNPGDATSNGSDAFLYSKEQYANFEWRLDFKVNAGGNSGAFIRTQNDWYCDGFEVGILDSKDGGDADARSPAGNNDKLSAGIINAQTGQPFATGSNAPVKRSASIYDMYPTTKDGILIPNGGVYVDPMKPANQWNSMVIWANGNYVETWLNGIKVTDFEIGSADYMARFHRSKFGNNNNQCGDDFGKLPTGNLAIQDHGGTLRIWLRNLKIRTFTPGAKLPSPLAVPNGGSFAAATKVKLDAGVTGAVIRYTLDGSEPTETSSLYNDSLGITVSQSGVLKSKTFRARFAASDAASASFTISGSRVKGGRLAALPGVEFVRASGDLLLLNPTGQTFSIDLVSTKGDVLRSLDVGALTGRVVLDGIGTGIYLIRMRTGTGMDSRLLAVP